MSQPTLSIVVVFFNMRREAPRTLLSLTTQYQFGVADLDYEVICIDNGSAEPLDAEVVRSIGPQFHYHFFATDSKSPAAAINFGVSQARAEHVMVIPDGANILTLRVFWYVLKAIRQYADPLVGTTFFAIDPPTREQLAGWNQDAEDRLLAASDWPRDGYALFTLTRSFRDGAAAWFGCQFESTCFTLRKSTFDELGGFDTRFRSPGGGLVSLDFFQRAMARPGLVHVMLLGEATFHQYHGGAVSGGSADAATVERFHAEYRAIHGRDFEVAARLPVYLGQFPPQALRIAELAAERGFPFLRENFTPPAAADPRAT